MAVAGERADAVDPPVEGVGVFAVVVEWAADGSGHGPLRSVWADTSRWKLIASSTLVGGRAREGVTVRVSPGAAGAGALDGGVGLLGDEDVDDVADGVERWPVGVVGWVLGEAAAGGEVPDH